MTPPSNNTAKGDSSDLPPSMAQTYMQGPIKANGSGKALSKKELEDAKAELEQLKRDFGFREPIRSFMDDPDIKWRFDGPPDYSIANLAYFKGRSKEHKEGSLEEIVENLVKTWEMERSHKLDYKQHQAIDPENFLLSANGGKKFNSEQAHAVGNYNVLLNSVPAEIWDGENITWDHSHEKFHNAFAAFPWEVLEVFSGPPTVGFTWRHWGHFTGSYEENQGKGDLIEMYGFGIATVNGNLQLCNCEFYYNAENFIKILRGEMKSSDVQGGRDFIGPLGGLKGGCPHLARCKAGGNSNDKGCVIS